jgi:aryl-alcohol dehydrogenase-like predicted oxidoreductase
VRSDPEYVRTACEKSLRRLGVSVIDLYYCHRVDKKTPIEKTIEAMVQLKNEGKIRYLGLSEVSSRTLRRAHAVHPISAVQMEYSPFDLDVEKEGLLDACRELGVSLVAYGPLAKGMITAQYKSNADFGEGDSRRDHPRYSDENFPKNMKLVEHFKQFAAKKGCTPGQLSIAFLLAQGDEIIPIPGTQKIKYLDENLGALNVILTPVELTELRSAVDAAAVFGSRVGATSGAMSSEYHYADTPEL